MRFDIHSGYYEPIRRKPARKFRPQYTLDETNSTRIYSTLSATDLCHQLLEEG